MYTEKRRNICSFCRQTKPYCYYLDGVDGDRGGDILHTLVVSHPPAIVVIIQRCCESGNTQMKKKEEGTSTRTRTVLPTLTVSYVRCLSDWARIFAKLVQRPREQSPPAPARNICQWIRCCCCCSSSSSGSSSYWLEGIIKFRLTFVFPKTNTA